MTQNKIILPDKAEIFLLWFGTQKNMAPASVKSYESDLLDFEIFLETLAKTLDKPEEIKKKDIQLYLGILYNKNYEKSSVARKLSALRAFFNYALKRKYILQSPLISVKNPKLPKKQPDVPSVEQVLYLLESPPISPPKSPKEYSLFCRDMALVELLYGSGLRISEALSLNLADYTPEKKFLIVLGKGNKQRLVPLTEQSLICLETWLKQYPFIAPFSHPQHTPLFIGARGARLNRREALRIIEKIQKTADTPHLTPHSFRHAYATHLLESGLDLRTVQELLGHSRIATTQIYTHLNISHLTEVYQKTHKAALEKEKKEI